MSVRDKDEEVNLRTVRQSGTAIRHIENPSEAVQMAAVNNSPLAFLSAEDPTPSVQLFVARTNGRKILSFKNPTESARLAAFVSAGPTIVNSTRMFKIWAPSALGLADAFNNATHRFDFSAPNAPAFGDNETAHVEGMARMLEILRDQTHADILVLAEAAPSLFENTVLTEILRDILLDQASPNKTSPAPRSM